MFGNELAASTRLNLRDKTIEKEIHRYLKMKIGDGEKVQWDWRPASTTSFSIVGTVAGRIISVEN